jgi:hypothetical protein
MAMFRSLHATRRRQASPLCVFSSSTSERVTVERLGNGLAIVTLNRPEKKNALDMDM